MIRKNFYLTQEQSDFLASLDGNVSEHIRRAIDEYIARKKQARVSESVSERR